MTADDLFNQTVEEKQRGRSIRSADLSAYAEDPGQWPGMNALDGSSAALPLRTERRRIALCFGGFRRQVRCRGHARGAPLRGAKEIMIEHGEMQYRLQITKAGKLILTK